MTSFHRRHHHHRPQRYSIRVSQVAAATHQEKTKMIGNITAGTAGQFAASLLDNGSLYTAPAGSAYTLNLVWTASDPSVTFAPATTDATNGAVPLQDQTVVTVPAGDPGTSVTVTATAPAPDGTTATGSLTVQLTPVPQKFTLAVAQIA
jgi:hypothetical protein